MISAGKIAAAVAAGLILGGSAVVSVKAEAKPTIVFVTNGASDFWKAAAAGVKKAQAELPGYTLELQYPDQATVAAQNQLMDNLVSAGVKGIIVSAVDPKNLDL